eukprot:m51a1_g14074 putative protein (729) ;mRNA; f:1279496-1289436
MYWAVVLLGAAALLRALASTSLDAGLILHWSFDGANSSSRLADSSGNGLYAAISGTYKENMSWVPGIVGDTAIKLIPTWTKSYALGAYSQASFKGYPAVLQVQPRQTLFVGAKDRTYSLPTFRAIAGEWMHVVMTYDGATGGSAMTTYINGGLVDISVVSLDFMDSAQLFVGLSELSGNQLCFSGLIDDVRLYGRPLTSREASDLWRGICNGTGFFLPEGARTAPCEAFRCPAGTADSDGDSSTACVACAAGQYAPAGAGSCADCAAGATDSDGDPSTPCVACGPGHHIPGTATAGPCSALACAAGWTDDDWDTSTACVQCGAGTEAPAGSHGPCAGLACRAGFVDDDSDPATPCASVCAPLATPELCNASADGCGWCYTRCAPLSPLCNPGCPAGTTGIGYNATTPCRPCGPGAYVPAGSVGLCPLFACPSGTADTDSDPSTPCAPCPAGSYAQPATAGPCPACPAGSTDHDGNSSTQCVACGAGAFVPRGSSGPCSLFACPDGLFDNDSDPSTPCASSCLLIAMPVVCYDSVYGCEWCGSACAPAGGCGIVVKHPPTSDGLVLHWSFEEYMPTGNLMELLANDTATLDSNLQAKATVVVPAGWMESNAVQDSDIRTLGTCGLCRHRSIIQISGQVVRTTDELTGDHHFRFIRCTSNCNSSRLHLGGKVELVLRVLNSMARQVALLVSEPLLLLSKTGYRTARATRPRGDAYRRVFKFIDDTRRFEK